MLALQTLGSSVFSETVQVHVHTVGYGMNSNMGADGWTPVQTVPDGYVCPAVVNKYNWDTAAAGVHAEASDEFYLRQTGNSIQVKKKLEEGAPVEFGLNLAFPCVKGAVQDTQCQTLVIGGSFDAGVTTYDASNEAWSKAFTVPAGVTCPAFVTKANWHQEHTGMHKDYDDKFHVRQSDATVHVRREGPDKNWGMVLAFDCCIPSVDTCVHEDCNDWDCSKWCTCFDETKASVYTANNCDSEDGDECDCPGWSPAAPVAVAPVRIVNPGDVVPGAWSSQMGGCNSWTCPGAGGAHDAMECCCSYCRNPCTQFGSPRDTPIECNACTPRADGGSAQCASGEVGYQE